MRRTPSRAPRLGVRLAALALLSLATAAGRAAEPAAKAPAPPLAITGVSVTPADAGADTLCQLRVEVANHGERIASQLAFSVTVNGAALPVYANQLFMQRIEPGKSATVRLYNFWTSESSRPPAADGRYRVEVSLVGASWYRIAPEAGVEVWTPLEPVQGLPVAATATVGKAPAKP
jgi:hypothetical protein